MKVLLEKLTYANVMATIAVFVALGGASYAAVSLPRNSVGANQIKDRAIGAAKLKGGAVTAPKIGKEAVTGSKIKLSTVGTVPSAQRAASADNAQLVGGSTVAQITSQAAAQGASAARLRCPAGTVASTGVCFGPQHEPTSWYEAIEACADEGRTLPTPAELYAYGRVHTQVDPGFEWTGNALSTTEVLAIEAFVGGYGAAERNVFGSSLPYHCVGYRVN